jgi:ketosteroid isomerase-like protein
MSDQTDIALQTNVAVVQQAYEAFGRGDIPAVLDSLTDDVEWTMQGPSVIPFSGTFRGREGIAEFFGLLGDTIEFEQFEPRNFVGQGTPSSSWATSAMSSSRRGVGLKNSGRTSTR